MSLLKSLKVTKAFNKKSNLVSTPLVTKILCQFDKLISLLKFYK